MAFGITRQELQAWKRAAASGEIAFLTHYWYDSRFPQFHTVTKVGCSDLVRLTNWCIEHGLNPAYIHKRQPYPHFDLIGPKQVDILRRLELKDHLERFNL